MPGIIKHNFRQISNVFNVVLFSIVIFHPILFIIIVQVCVLSCLIYNKMMMMMRPVSSFFNLITFFCFRVLPLETGYG